METERIRTYRDMVVWKRGMELTRQLYALTQHFPHFEQYGLAGQIRRAAVSVPSNIAEGQARRTPKDFIQFLYIAKGSLAELDTQLTLAHDFSYIDVPQHEMLMVQIDALQRMLFNLIEKLGGSK